ncbi:MAG TPA: alpha/beta hydrolase-fold protein, partial [Armatimonadota bacterium]
TEVRRWGYCSAARMGSAGRLEFANANLQFGATRGAWVRLRSRGSSVHPTSGPDSAPIAKGLVRMIRSMPLWVPLVLLCLSVPAAQAQAPRGFTPPPRSPEVLSDGRATFRLRAPNAKEVAVNCEGTPRLVLTKDEQGVWSGTTPALTPDFYGYSFSVDGLTLADPSNPLIKAGIMGGPNSIVHVPGPSTLSWEVGNVPHGVVHRHVYHSQAIGDERDFYVYTPPGYDPKAATKYPVLFLLHGMGDNATSWVVVGRSNVILDNLIALGKTKPMLVVNTLGYGVPNPEQGMSGMFSPEGQQKSRDAFTASVLKEVLPLVEKSYRVAEGRENRAITGLSMGGGQSLGIGLNNLDTFAWIGSFSGAPMMFGETDKAFGNLSEKDNDRIKLLWIACGSEDFLLNANKEFKSWLKGRKVNYTEVETPGAHAWPVWRRNLTEFTQFLFK